jgi:dolichol kinase
MASTSGARPGSTTIVVADVMTTLVATAAVAPFAVYHFHRLSHYGVVAISSPCRWSDF